MLNLISIGYAALQPAPAPSVGMFIIGAVAIILISGLIVCWYHTFSSDASLYKEQICMKMYRLESSLVKRNLSANITSSCDFSIRNHHYAKFYNGKPKAPYLRRFI